MGPSEGAFLVEACGALPPEVQTLHIDLKALEQLDPSALAIVQSYAVRWHMSRSGTARVEFSALSLRSSVNELIRRRTRSRTNGSRSRGGMVQARSAHGTQ